MSIRGNISFGAATLLEGRSGVTARAIFTPTKAGEWSGSYEFTTYGMTSEAITARLAEIDVYHAKKEKRLNGFLGIVGTAVDVAGEILTIVDCTLSERGTNVEIYIDVRAAGDKRVDGFPLRVIYPTIDTVPDDAAIIAIVGPKHAAVLDAHAEHAEVIAQVKQMLGGV